MPRTIVLAYSGGLDTSIIVPWLRENYDGRSVICVAADIGQGGDELAGVRAKAIASGAEECYVEDLREEFVEISSSRRSAPAPSTIGSTCSAPPWRARSSPRARSRSRAASAPMRSRTAAPARATIRCASSSPTPRFAPDLPVIAPWREWDIRSREDAIAYAESRGIPDRRDARRRSTRATRISGTSRTRAASSRIRTPRRRTTVHAHHEPSCRRPTRPRTSIIGFERGHAGLGQRHAARPRRPHRRRSTRSAARTASASSTSSRIAWSA